MDYGQRGYIRKDSEEVLKTHLAAMDAEEKKRTLTGSNDMDTSMSVLGARGRPPMGAAEHSEASRLSRHKRHRADALRAAFLAEMEVVKEHASWRNPEL